MSGKLVNPRGKILKAIRDSVHDRGYPPSIKEIAEAVGLNSTSTVHHHLRILQDQGLIVRAADRQRGIVVHTPPDALLEDVKAALAALDKGFTATARQILTDLLEDLGSDRDPINSEAAPDAPEAAPDHPKEIQPR